MRIRPGNRPPVQRFVNRPFNVQLLQALEGRSGNWAALRPFEVGSIALSEHRVQPRSDIEKSLRKAGSCKKVYKREPEHNPNIRAGKG